MRHETIDVRKKGVRRETIDASHVRSAPAAAWPKVRLGEVLRIKHGYAFDGSGITTEDNGVVLVTPGNFQIGGGFKDNNKKFFAQDYPTDYVLKRDDFIVTMTDLSKDTDTLGYSAKIPDSNKVYLHNQRIGLVDVFNPAADREYVYWFMRTRQYQRIIAGCASGVSVKHTSPTKIYGAEIPLPPLPVQRRIADILSAYDDLIENNRRRIAILEETARLAYRKWFGRAEQGRTATIGEVCQTFGGGTPKTSVPEFWDGDIPWVVPTDITRNTCLAVLDTERKISELGLQKSSAKMLPANAILMTSRASVGYFGIADFPVCTNQGFISIIPNDDSWRWYLLFNLMSRVEEIRSNAKGATFPEIGRARFRSMDVAIPDDNALIEFNGVVAPLIQQVRVLAKQNATLAAARDMLLPRLMKGFNN